jgi:hypothetical protein
MGEVVAIVARFLVLQQQKQHKQQQQTSLMHARRQKALVSSGGGGDGRDGGSGGKKASAQLVAPARGRNWNYVMESGRVRRLGIGACDDSNYKSSHCQAYINTLKPL